LFNNTNEIKAYKTFDSKAIVEQTKIHRDWMDDTYDKHAYKCFPVSLANTIGWSISFTEDIEFIKHSHIHSQPDNVEILKGKDICNNSRFNDTVSFNTGLILRTNKNTTILSIAPPNYRIDGIQPFTTLMSTSFYQHPMPVAWHINKSDQVIKIPAGTPVITLIPISLKSMENTEFIIEDYNPTNEEHEAKQKYGEKISSLGEQGIYTTPYRNATNEDGIQIGEHEVKSLKLITKDNSKTPNII
jgi:hypothetical protein